jgi:metal-sulfur cluster biosynthetic enzyme
METDNVPKLSWQITDTNPELVEPLKESLRKVVDPELGLNIIELGLIREVRIEKKEAQIEMILTTPFCPYGPALLEMARKKAEETIGKPTKIDLGLTPWTPAMMEDETGMDWGLY